MTHFVLLKLVSGCDLEAVEQRVKQTYHELDKVLPYLNYPTIYRSCIERDSNADLMIKVQLDTPDQLQAYLTHPLHLQMGQELRNEVAQRISFDYL